MARWIVGGAVALYFVWGIADALCKGVANQAGTPVARCRAPVHFWALITGWSAFAAFILIGLLFSIV